MLDGQVGIERLLQEMAELRQRLARVEADLDYAKPAAAWSEARQLSATLQDMQLDAPKPPALSAPRIPGTLGVPRGEASQPVADKPKPKHEKVAAKRKPQPAASAVAAEPPTPDQQGAQAEASAPMAKAASVARMISLVFMADISTDY